MGTVHYTDEALLLSGELEDFGRFYDRYVTSLLGFFQRRVLDPEAAADLTAETFAAAMVARPQFRAEATAAGGCSGSPATSSPTTSAGASPRTGCACGLGCRPWRSARRTPT